MSTKENYQEKLEAEVELALATLTKLRAQARNSKADARIKYSEQIDKLEKEVVAVRSKIKEMAEASEDSWQTLKDGWSALSSAVQDTVAKLKD
jgi:phage host-nuclease inhibitor protein Gam